MHCEHQKQRAKEQVATNFELNTGCVWLNISPNIVKADVTRSSICELIQYDKSKCDIEIEKQQPLSIGCKKEQSRSRQDSISNQTFDRRKITE